MKLKQRRLYVHITVSTSLVGKVFLINYRLYYPYIINFDSFIPSKTN